MDIDDLIGHVPLDTPSMTWEEAAEWYAKNANPLTDPPVADSLPPVAPT